VSGNKILSRVFERFCSKERTGKSIIKEGLAAQEEKKDRKILDFRKLSVKQKASRIWPLEAQNLNN
jgi:hypothetical protein